MKRALILGVTGQDGQFLSDILIREGYSVLGLSRNIPKWHLNPLNLLRPLHVIGDVSDYSSLRSVVENFQPNEIYNLSGESSVAESFRFPGETTKSVAIGAINLFNTVRELTLESKVKIFQAGSSDMFGNSSYPLTEKSAFNPKSPYAISKYVAYKVAIEYRASFGLWISNGLLFNHESELRPSHFVFPKIINSLVDVHLGKLPRITLGNLGVSRDWGYARDYAEGIYRTLRFDRPEDFVLSTGKSHSLIDIIRKGMELLEIKVSFDDLVVCDPTLIRPIDVEVSQGNSAFAKEKLGWEARTHFDELVSKMIAFSLKQKSGK